VLNLARADEAAGRKRCGESRAILARPAWFAASVARTLGLTAPSPKAAEMRRCFVVPRFTLVERESSTSSTASATTAHPKRAASFELAVLHDELRSVVRRRLPGASRQNLGLRFLAAELTQTGGEGQVSGTESQFRMHRIS